MSIPLSDLTVRSEGVQKLYTDYLADRFSVNRRYQRKLVWTVEEKCDLIDSILSDLPIPLILVAEISGENGTSYELIDGMQRLNAIFSFIENEFDIDGQHFDLQALADTKSQLDDGKFTQKTPILPREKSRKIANYLLPMSIFKASNPEQVDKVFRRINSGGRRLSGQDLRQVGSTAKIAQLVRVIASEIRGDSSSSDIVPLRAMPKLSINNRHLAYGVDVDNIFWVQQAILRRIDVRSSLDEQLILDILVDCLVDPLVSSGTYTRDSVYGSADANDAAPAALERRLSERIEIYGESNIREDFSLVYEELRAVLDVAGERFVKHVVDRSPGGRYPRYFQAVFLAFWELIIRSKMRVSSRQDAALKLRSIGTNRGPLNIPGGGGDWTAEDKRKNIDVVKGAIRDAFEFDPGSRRDAAQFGLASNLERILQNSVTEQSLFELKQGLLTLGAKREFDEGSWEKILCTITAIANAGPDCTGYLVIGVADDEKDVDRIRLLDGVEPVKSRSNRFDIVGIDREAEVRGESLKSYYDWVSDKLTGSDLAPDLRKRVASEISLVDYHGQAVILIKITPSPGPSFYKNVMYERIGSGIKAVEQADYIRLFQRFTTRT
ncbi:GmrSD restriction endonuclease domain-containing protein [Streptomyces sp. WL006]|uniref:GmrSD restriction endonuclease domain-containing protein n=1 Tax=Streptomyces sp. WL006 TaxID=3423915 RepID=UPI003F6BF354